MATFSFFIFLVYAGFGTMLAVFRVDFIKESNDPPPESGEIEDDENTSGDVSKIEYQDN